MEGSIAALISPSSANATQWVSESLKQLIQNAKVWVERVSIMDPLIETPQEQEIRECLENESFWFVAQGIFDQEGVLKKTELLARLAGRKEALVPDVFIPIIERIWYRTVFDYLVIERAFERISQTNPAVPCSINVNPSTFENNGYFLSRIDALQKRYKIQPTQVIFEILESEWIYDYKGFNPILSELRKRGYGIAVDDFHPVGNHNMFCVNHLSGIDTVKFDGVYLQELYKKGDKKLVMRELFTTLGSIRRKHPHIDIVVEKIEDENIFLFFRDIFAKSEMEKVYFQGHYFNEGSAF